MASRSGIRVIPLKTKNTEKPEFAGDYVLKSVVLINHVGFKVDVKHIMLELNIYESIYNNAITGSIVIADEGNQIARMSIQGLERIAFHLKTPGVAYGKEDVVDASEETGEPYHIYKISDRKQLNQGIMSYTLHFASREFMRNIRTKVSQAYDGKYDRAVIDIMKDKDYLDSRKKLYYEPTGNSNKIVIPNLSPFDAIDTIAQKSVADKSKGVGYYFYETTGGYYFRSWQSMITNQGEFARPPRQQFYYQPQRMGSNSKSTNQDKIERAYESVEEYEFITNFHDVAANTILGTYGHRVISHNLFDKSYDINDYNFHNEYRKTPHTDTVEDAKNKFPISNTPVDYDNNDNISNYAESRVSLQATTPFLHDKDVGKYGLDALQDGLKTGQRVSQSNQVTEGTALKLVIKGQSNLQAGDLIEFNLKDVNSANKDNTDDPRFSGNYIITKIRHQVTGDQYRMILECAKDSVATSYGDLGDGYNGADAGFAMNIHTANRSELQLEEIDSDIYT
jgi:hypothetical protein